MKTLRTFVLVLVALVMTMTYPSASGNVGIYGIVERVTFEGSPTPQRVQVWGAFAFANGGVGNASEWSAVKRGYLYFRVPDASVASASEIEMVRREWADLQSVAGKGQVVAFGRWGYIGRFESLLGEGKPMFLERAPRGGEYTDLRVRPATATPSAPAAYHTNAGVVRIPDSSHADLVKQLRAAVASAGGPSFSLQTGPPVAAMPDPATPGEKKLKDVAFVVRSVGCADVASFRVTANAVGLTKGPQKSVTLKVIELPAGVFALAGHDMRSTSVVSVSAVCGRQVAGAIVRLVNGAYRRDAVELLSHHPGADDVERAVALLTGGGRRP
jgi:hypothetical protein